MKEKLIKKLEEKGYLPDEARHTVESHWWMIKLFVEEVYHSNDLI